MRKLVRYVVVAVLFGTSPCSVQEAVAEDIPDGKGLYSEHGAKCHGGDLEGGKPPASSMACGSMAGEAASVFGTSGSGFSSKGCPVSTTR